jgi:hypothetical protein
MTWELYEVWTEDDDGYSELIDTTKSLTEARSIANKVLDENIIVLIYRELNGELELVEELQRA